MHFALAFAAILTALIAPAGHAQAAPTRGAGDAPSGTSATRRITAAPTGGRVVVDGVLDEQAWQAAIPAAGFVQSEPRTGEPATEATEVRVLFDDRALYIGAFLHDREADKLIVNDIRKDFKEDDQDTFEVLIDTFRDHRNGYLFIANSAGARADKQVANEGREINGSWDAVWTVKTRRAADGWTVEMAIPFSALRYDLASAPDWGINFSRRIRRRNEVDFWAPVPRQYNLTRVSLAGVLEGVGRLATSRDLRVKPYVAASSVRGTGEARFDDRASAGVDVKYGITRGLTLDVTVRPDFAQVEVDEQTVNLTQFSQFFPEKREFFLENSGIFYVGDASRQNRVNLSPTPDEDMLLFFSRRIGLTGAGRPITIPAGVRLTGQLGGFTVGGLTMQTRAEGATPGNNYSVFRVRRNFSSGSDAGLLVMNRQADTAGSWNRVFGGDANIRFFGKVDWNSYLMGSAAPGAVGGQYALRTSVNYDGKFFHGKGGVLEVGKGFQDDLGFLRRTDVRKYLLDVGIRPRFAALQRLGLRELHPHATWNYYENLQGVMIGKQLHTANTFFFNNGAYFEIGVNPQFQHTNAPLALSPSIPAIPAGDYFWHDYALKGQTDPSRTLSATFTFSAGGLWSGTGQTQVVTLTARPSYHLGASVGASHTSASLDSPHAKFDALLWTGRANYSFTPNMFLDALTQYDPRRHLFNANVRFKVTHHPLSDLFIVFNEQRFTTPDAPRPGRSVAVKLTQMFSL